MTQPNGTGHREIVDTHRHPVGPKLAAKMAERGLYDPNQEFPQTNPLDFVCYRDLIDLDYAMAKQREGGVTLSLVSNGGEVDWIARDLLQVSTGDALKFLSDEFLEIQDRYPGEFAIMANAHAPEEGCRPIVEERISQGRAKAIAVASSYGSDRTFLDSPKAEWLWEFAEANDIVVHIHPPLPYGIEEHIRIVEDVLPSPAERQRMFSQTSNRVFRLGLSDINQEAKPLTKTAHAHSQK